MRVSVFVAKPVFCSNPRPRFDTTMTTNGPSLNPVAFAATVVCIATVGEWGGFLLVSTEKQTCVTL